MSFVDTQVDGSTETFADVVRVDTMADLVQSMTSVDTSPANPMLMSRAVALWKAYEYDGTQLLKDLTSNGLHAQLGATAAVESTDPKYLDYKPWGVNLDNSITFNGVNGLGVLAGTAPLTNITGDLDIEAKVQPTAWVGGSVNTTFASAYTGSAGTTTFLFQRTVGGALMCYFSVGGVIFARTSSVAVPAGTKWVRVTRSAATGVTTFYTSSLDARPLAGEWVQLGTTFAGTAGALSTSSVPLRIGAWSASGSDPFSGTISRVIVKGVIDSTPLYDFDVSKIKGGPFYKDPYQNLWYGLGSAAWGDHLKLSNIVGNNAASNYVPTFTRDEIDVAVLATPNFATSIFASQWLDADNFRWWFEVSAASKLRVRMFVGLTDCSLASDGPNVSLVTPMWFRLKWKRNRGDGNAEAKFFTSMDGVVWTQDGTTQTRATFAQPAVPTAALGTNYVNVGGYTSSQAAMFRMVLRSSVDGPVVASPRFDRPLKWSNGQQTDPYGNVWTINRSALQNRLKVVPNNYVENGLITGDNRIDTPIALSERVNGDLDTRIKVMLVDWTPTATCQLMGARTNGGIEDWALRVNAGGSISLLWWQADGTLRGATTSSPSVNTIPDGTVKWVRATLDVDNGAGQYEVKFWLSDDGIVWTQFGATQTGSTGVTSVRSISPTLQMIGWGSAGVLESTIGRVYEGQVWKGIPGLTPGARLVANPKFTALTSYAPYREVSVAGAGEAAWLAKDYNPAAKEYLKDRTGRGHHMRLGSVGRAEVLGGALVLPGVAANYAGTPSTTRTELCANPSFETGIAGVGNFSGNPTLVQSTDFAFAGTNSLKMTSTQAGDMAWSYAPNTINIPVTPGVQYSFRMRVYSPVTARQAIAEIVWRDAANGFINATFGDATLETVGAWTTLAVNGVAPANAVSVRLAGLVKSVAVVGESHYFDDLSCWRSDTDLNVEGDIDLRWYGSVDNWASAADQELISKFDGVGSQRSYTFRILSGGALFLQLSPDGVGTSSLANVPSPGIANGVLKWLRVTWRQSDGRTQFFTSDDGVAWTQTGTNQTIAIPSIFAGTSNLTVGAVAGSGTSRPLAGRTVRAVVKSGIDGASVFDVDFSTLRDGTPWFNDTGSKRVTIFPVRAAVVGGEFYTPGVGGHYASAAMLPATSFTGDLDMRWQGKLDNFTTNQALVSQYVVGQRRAVMWVSNVGALRLSASADGNTEAYTPASTVTLAAAGVPLLTDVYLRVTRVAATGATNFYYSFDGTTWTPIGAQVIGAPSSAPAGNLYAASASPVVVGHLDLAASFPLAGRTKKAMILNGIGGTAVFSVDFTTWSDGDGMGGYPKLESTGKYVQIVTDTTGADTNDPKWLKYEGEKYSSHPGTALNYISSPHQSAFSIIGDIEFIVCVAFDTLAAGYTQYILAKDGGADPNRSFWLGLTNAGALSLEWSPTGNGANAVGLQPSIPLANLIVPGQKVWIKANLDVDNGAAGKTATFWISNDGITWTQIGNSVVQAGTTSISASNAAVTIGAYGVSGGGGPMVGRVYRAIINNGIGGPTVFNYDASLLNEPYDFFSSSLNLIDKDSSDAEGGATQWQTYGTNTFARSLEQATEGVASFKYVFGTPADNRIGSYGPQVVLKPNTTYTMRCAAYVPASWDGGVVTITDDGTFVGATGGVHVDSSNAVRDAWQVVTYKFTTGADALGTIVLRVTGSPTTGKFLYIDQIGIFEGTSSTWVAGATPLYINRAATGRKLAVVDRTMFLFGADDYMECADHGTLDFLAGDSFTVSSAIRGYNLAAGAEHTYLGKTSGLSSTGWDLYKNSAGGAGNVAFHIRDAATSVYAAMTTTDGKFLTLLGVRDVPLDKTRFYWDSLVSGENPDLTIGDLANTDVVRIGRRSGAATMYADMEWSGASVHRSLLSEADRGVLTSELLGLGDPRPVWSFNRAPLSARAELRTGRYLYTPGSNNYPAAAENVEFRIGQQRNFDVRVDVSSDDWNAGTFEGYMAHSSAGTGFLFYRQSHGYLVVRLGIGSGLSSVFFGSPGVSSLPGTTTGRVGLRAKFVYDNGAGASEVQFYRKAVSDGDGVDIDTGWTLIGTAVNPTGKVDIAIPTTGTALQVNAGNDAPSRVHALHVLDDTTVVASTRFADALLMPVEPHNGFTDLYGNAWTLNRTTTGVKLAYVIEPTFLFGVDDYLLVPDSPLLDATASEDLTVITVFRRHGTPPSSVSTLVDKKGDAGAGSIGWILYTTIGGAPTWMVCDLATRPFDQSAVVPAGIRSSAAGVRDAANLTALTNVANDGVAADTTVGSLANTRGVFLNQNNDLEYFGTAIFKEALTLAQITEVINSFDYSAYLDRQELLSLV